MCPVFSGRMSGHRVRHRGSCSFTSALDFYLALYSNSSILGQDVLDIVSNIVDPAASILHLTFYLALCIVQPDLIP